MSKPRLASKSYTTRETMTTPKEFVHIASTRCWNCQSLGQNAITIPFDDKPYYCYQHKQPLPSFLLPHFAEKCPDYKPREVKPQSNTQQTTQ